ncbi:hypothetical protein PM004_17395 [Clostridium paraputrificum]|uniref:hypothetical protein n=1 Tax=Clostridium paraputrificum TaxID=29363 RepID=UPI00232B55A5|nr:hypothetical protein [Clostridium paraputrificum]MDB2091111.1 hypothetical protein [Clostridium paraputrificum]MDB2097871.1 hypothetical protein [Clostridium paraputrificum]
MVNIDKLFGKDFLDYIQEQQNNGKTLEDIGKEHNKTKEAIRSKIKREKKKLNTGIVKKSTNNTPIKPKIEKPIKLNKKDTNSFNSDIDIAKIENKLDFIINLIENSTEKDITVQNVGQALQIDVQHKKFYVKTSMRVEKDVWQEFLEFAKSKNKDYKQQDLISLALREFLQKYNGK